ncbi:MAG: antibiotic biosynthesis monooxygenase family protein [Sporichthyaceae bacterium]
MRVVTWRIPTDPVDAVRALGDVDEKIGDFIRILHQQKGFLSAHWGMDVEPGRMAVVSYWASREAIEDADFVLKYLQQRAPWPAVQVEEQMLFELG